GSGCARDRAPGRWSGASSRDACCRITPRWKLSWHDSRRGTRPVPRLRALRVSQRRLARSGSSGRPRRGPRGARAGPHAGAGRERDLTQGRSGKAYIEEMLELRERVRSGIAAVLGTSAELVALVESTTRGCQVAIGGLGLGPKDEVVTSDQEHFGLLGPLHESGARVVGAEADEDALLCAGPPRTRL